MPQPKEWLSEKDPEGVGLGHSMPRGPVAALLLLILHGAWSCLDLTCYTDYLWTITCVLETRSPNPSILSLTWH